MWLGLSKGSYIYLPHYYTRAEAAQICVRNSELLTDFSIWTRSTNLGTQFCSSCLPIIIKNPIEDSSLYQGIWNEFSRFQTGQSNIALAIIRLQRKRG